MNSEQILADRLIADLATSQSPLNEFCAIMSADQLINWLDRMFPEKCPNPGQSIEEIWMEVGKREVIRILHQFQYQRDEEISEKNSTTPTKGAY